MNNKAYIYSIMLVIITAVALTSALVRYSNVTETLAIGTRQSEVITKYQDARAELINVDNIATYSSINALYTLAENGLFKTSPCKEYFKYHLWSNKNKDEEYAECIPEIQKEITEYIDMDFKFYATLKNKLKIYGVSPKNKNISFENGVYELKPSFTKEINYNNDTVKKIKEFIDNVNNKCEDEENEELVDCIEKVNKDMTPLPLEGNEFFQYLSLLENIKQKNCYVEFSEVKGKYEIKKQGDHSLINKKYYDEVIWVTKEDRYFFPNEIVYDDGKISFKTQEGEFKEETGMKFFITNEGRLTFLKGDKPIKCDVENRMFAFELNTSEVYPEKGELSHKFAIYVKDRKPPEIREFFVPPKEFDEGTILVRWIHTDSKDLKKYVVKVDGKVVKTINPWQNVIIHNSINWNFGDGMPFSTCSLEKENSFTQCKYSFGDVFEDEKVYYFKENNEFVYVLSGLQDERPYSIEIEAWDNAKNMFRIHGIGRSEDTLPFEPLKFSVFVDPLRIENDRYYGVRAGLTPPSYNMDGSEPKPFKFNLKFVHSTTPIEVVSNYENFDFIVGAPVPNYQLEQLVNYLIVADDPSLDNIDLYVNKMGYEVKTIP